MGSNRFVALAALVVGGCTLPQSQALLSDRASAASTSWQAYEAAIPKAALSTTAYTLLPIRGPGEVTVVHVQSYPTIAADRETWVALPEELKPLCRGKKDPRLALQMALGLQPKLENLQVFTLSVNSSDLFRPCATSAETGSSACPKTVDPKVAPRPRDISEAHARFMTRQMAASYRPDGYPFTGMGWSYNWDPESPSPRGVSEYVLKAKSRFATVRRESPAEFCNGTTN